MPYREAVQWLADNDDTDWLDDPDGCFSVTTALVADIYDRHTDEVAADLRRIKERPR